MTLELDRTSLQLAERLGAVAHACDVVSTTPLSPSIVAVVLRGNAAVLAGTAGNDVMIRVADEKGRFVRRRYSVRELDEPRDEFTLWVTIDHVGPGSNWVKRARMGDVVEVIGPRGKILLESSADWHLFVGDTSGLAAFYRLAQSIEVPSKAVFIVEIDTAQDALGALFADQLDVTGVFIERRGRSTSDPAGLMSGLATFALPPGRGHAYLFGEFHVTRSVQDALLDRGLEQSQISHKAFWRNDRSNADHGEPVKTDS